MLQIQLDETKLEQIYRDMCAERLAEIENEKVFWTTADLSYQTGIKSFVNLQKIFLQSDFPKFRLGVEWRFPAKEAREWLEKWWKTQKRA